MLLAMCCSIALTQTFKAPMAKTELVASTTQVTPGKPYQIALHMKMAPGWHSYYINPGESGMATKIVWHLPAGFKAGPIRWPVPERIIVGDVAQFVYEKDVWLVTDITPPSQPWRSDRPLAISADVSWLLCREACVPQKSHLSIPVFEGPATSPNLAFLPALKTLIDDRTGLTAKASVSAGKPVTLAVSYGVSSVGSVKFFPGDATYFGADLATTQKSAEGIILSIPVSKYAPSLPKRLTGILVIPESGGKGGGAHWIDIPVTKR